MASKWHTEISTGEIALTDYMGDTLIVSADDVPPRSHFIASERAILRACISEEGEDPGGSAFVDLSLSGAKDLRNWLDERIREAEGN